MKQAFFSTKGLFQGISEKFISYCDASEIDQNTPLLVEQANAKLEGDKPKIKTPMTFDSLKNTINNSSVSSYDGFRMVVQKQINLNTIATHFYWIGSQLTGQQIYQYRIILPSDNGSIVNVGTNIDLSSVEGEIKVPLTPSVSTKINFALTAEASQLQGEVEIPGASSSKVLQVIRSNETQINASYMQAIAPWLTLGGLVGVSAKSGEVTKAFGGILSYGDNSFYFLKDNNYKFLYQRRVNPNRVNLTADLVIDETGNSQMSVGAEYTLKQSKLHMSIDSNLQLKSLLEAAILPGFQLQFCAEVAQAKDVYRFGYGVVIG